MSPMHMEQACLTECAVLAACGDTKSLLSGLHNPPQEVLSLQDRWLIDRPAYFAEVPDDLPCPPPLPDTKTNQMLGVVLAELKTAVERLKAQYDPAKIAVVVGTTTTGMREVEMARKANADYNYHSWQELAAPAQFVADRLELSGPAIGVSTACTSGARALGLARRLLASGWCEAAIAGASESICHTTSRGFEALESLASGICRPFQTQRDGINIGEGAALFIMERGRRGVALAGYGETSDAYHQSAPDPAGTGAEKAIQHALHDAQCTPQDVDYINLHGTGTRLNDVMEAGVIARVFGDKTPASATKSVTGHTLGAAGAIEAAIAYLLLSVSEATVLPPHHGIENYDPALPRLNLVSRSHPKRVVKTILSTSYAFGGHNVALVLKKAA